MTISGPEGHITDRQFAECLDGTPFQAAVWTHVEACERCRRELEQFSDAISNFNLSASNWSRAQPVPSLHVIADRKPGRSLAAPLQWALAAVLLVGFALPVFGPSPLDNVVAIHAVRSQPAAVDDERQIAQDNELLQSVDGVLARTEPSPFEEYRLSREQAGTAASRPVLRTQ